jgi:redox-sensitive bicupin YhaK (pirin superfamily)
MDFGRKDGFSMYHGREVPGFPQHPHRGFETISIVRRGLIDHSDSLGARARFGRGDVQWMTAGAGVVHSEMFPLVHQDKENPVELFQLWLNLPAADKLVEPYFTMFWREDIPAPVQRDARGREAQIRLIAGQLDGLRALPPPPNSWANKADSDVLIATADLQPGATFRLPAASPEAKRTVFFYEGDKLEIAGELLDEHAALAVKPEVEFTVTAGPYPVGLLVMQGRPIGEPIVQHGPFVMNSREEIQRAISDYSRTRFGGWPWPSDAPVHPREQGRFAVHAGGQVEERL